MKVTADPKREAFTLIELLVVIAVIALLAGILFPVFAQARAKARQVICMNNEKQLAAAILMYAQDYDERWVDLYPNYNQSDPNLPRYNSSVYWITPRNYANTTDYLIKPYVQNDAIQGCPVLQMKRIKYANGGVSVPALYPNYAINELDITGVNSPYRSGSTIYNIAYRPPDFVPFPKQWWATGPFGRKTAQTAQPSGLIMLWEHNSTSVQCNIWSTEHDQMPDHWDASHHGGFNAAFADGHVKRWTLGQMTNQLVCYWELPAN